MKPFARPRTVRVTAFVAAAVALVDCEAYDRAFYRELTGHADAADHADVRADGRDAGPVDVLEDARPLDEPPMDTGTDATDVPMDTTVDATDVAVVMDVQPDRPVVDVPPDRAVTDVQVDVPVDSPCMPDSNLVANPGFEPDDNSWSVFLMDGVMARYSVSTTAHSGSGSLEADVIGTPAHCVDVQLAQFHLPVDSSIATRVGLWVMGPMGARVEAVMQHGSNPYTNYCRQVFTLPGRDWSYLSFDCISATTDPSAELAINLACATGTLFVDDVFVGACR